MIGKICKFTTAMVFAFVLGSFILFQYFPMGFPSKSSPFTLSHPFRAANTTVFVQKIQRPSTSSYFQSNLPPFIYRLFPLAVQNYLFQHTNVWYLILPQEYMTPTANKTEFQVKIPSSIVEAKNSSLIVFLSGARVEPSAYIPLWIRIVQEIRIPVILPNTFMHLSVLDYFVIDRIIAWYWSKFKQPLHQLILSAHSLGGYTVSKYMTQKRDTNEESTFYHHFPKPNLNKIIMWASYGSNMSLLQNISILHIYGTKDTVINMNTTQMESWYPKSGVAFVECKGCNHAQFGLYGKQFRDSEADISQEDQMYFIANQTIDFLQTK